VEDFACHLVCTAGAVKEIIYRPVYIQHLRVCVCVCNSWYISICSVTAKDWLILVSRGLATTKRQINIIIQYIRCVIV